MKASPQSYKLLVRRGESELVVRQVWNAGSPLAILRRKRGPSTLLDAPKPGEIFRARSVPVAEQWVKAPRLSRRHHSGPRETDR